MARCPRWLRPRLGACNLPGPDDLERLAREGVTLIVSLVEDEEFYDKWPGGPREFIDYAEHLGMRVVRLPTRDFGAPSQEEACRVLRVIHEELERGGKVVVHCYGGIGRTGTLLAAYLIVYEGYTRQEAVEEVSRIHARPQSPEQEYLLYALEMMRLRGLCP